MNIVTKMFLAVGGFVLMFVTAAHLPTSIIDLLNTSTLPTELVTVLKIGLMFIGVGFLFIPLMEGG